MTQPASKGQRAVETTAALPQQYLTFMLGGEAYALGILAIKEIIEHGQTTRVPMMPQFIRGVINLRGAVVPVIDLGVRFGAGSTAITRRTCIVIVEVANEDGPQDVGLLVDAVNEVKEIAAGDIEPAPAFGASIRTDFIAGMGRVEDKFVVILEPVRLLSVDEMAVLAEPGGIGAPGGAANDPAEQQDAQAKAA
jgi:purine-binding chemotaxis protein CheW